MFTYNDDDKIYWYKSTNIKNLKTKNDFISLLFFLFKKTKKGVNKIGIIIFNTFVLK